MPWFYLAYIRRVILFHHQFCSAKEMLNVVKNIFILILLKPSLCRASKHSFVGFTEGVISTFTSLALWLLWKVSCTFTLHAFASTYIHFLCWLMFHSSLEFKEINFMKRLCHQKAENAYYICDKYLSGSELINALLSHNNYNISIFKEVGTQLFAESIQSVTGIKIKCKQLTFVISSIAFTPETVLHLSLYRFICAVTVLLSLAIFPANGKGCF